jgi:hypothetical protein
MDTTVEGLPASVAARELGVSAVRRVRQLMSAGQLRFITTPLGRLVDPIDLQRLQAERAAKRQGSDRHAAW